MHQTAGVKLINTIYWMRRGANCMTHASMHDNAVVLKPSKNYMHLQINTYAFGLMWCMSCRICSEYKDSKLNQIIDHDQSLYRASKEKRANIVFSVRISLCSYGIFKALRPKQLYFYNAIYSKRQSLKGLWCRCPSQFDEAQMF